MSKTLYKQKDILDKLHKDGLATFKKASFSEAMRKGQIPYIIKDGYKHKLYDYEAVKKAIKLAGIGGVDIQKELDDLPLPKENQTVQEYGKLAVAELGDMPTVTEANIYKTIYQGKLEKLKYEREKALVISREEIEDKAFTVSRTIRDKLLSIPERLSNELANIDDAYVIKEMLYKEFTIILEGFTKESFYE